MQGKKLYQRGGTGRKERKNVSKVLKEMCSLTGKKVYRCLQMETREDARKRVTQAGNEKKKLYQRGETSRKKCLKMQLKY